MITTKSKLYKKLNYIPTAELRSALNVIISQNRNIDLAQAKLKKYLRPKEVELTKKHFGIE